MKKQFTSCILLAVLLCATLPLVASASVATSDDWSMFRHDATAFLH